jgi:hypothetical protein
VNSPLRCGRVANRAVANAAVRDRLVVEPCFSRARRSSPLRSESVTIRRRVSPHGVDATLRRPWIRDCEAVFRRQRKRFAVLHGEETCI